MTWKSPILSVGLNPEAHADRGAFLREAVIATDTVLGMAPIPPLSMRSLAVATLPMASKRIDAERSHLQALPERRTTVFKEIVVTVSRTGDFA